MQYIIKMLKIVSIYFLKNFVTVLLAVLVVFIEQHTQTLRKKNLKNTS